MSDYKEPFCILPLRDIVVFPNMIVPLFVGRSKSIKALDPNGKRLHQFLYINFTDINKRFKLGQNRININIDPLSLI